MDVCGDDDDEQFFETLEDITSSSDSEVGRKGKRCSNESPGRKDSAQNAQLRSQPSLSRYEIWTRNPGSIPERRQRLLSQMGLKFLREDSDNAVVVFEAAPSVAGQTPPTSPFSASLRDGEKDARDIRPTRESGGQGSAESLDVSIDKAAATNAREDGCTMTRSRSNGTFPRLADGHGIDPCAAPLLKSRSTSPVLPHSDSERLVETSGAVLRTDWSGPSHPASKPPLGARRISGRAATYPARHSFCEGIAGQRSVNQASSLEKAKVTDSNGKDSQCSDRECDDETLQRLLKIGRFSVESGEEVENSEDGDVLCRIKDLDSGKEFIVNEVGKDGLWNKLRELDTGRELTLEEFEMSLGLSPIVQEVMRRERQADDINATDTQMLAGTRNLKTKKGWLKAIKGVVRGSREKGSRSSLGISSDNRESSIEKSGRRSGSATDDSQDSPLQTKKRVKVHSHKKSAKEFGELHLMQEIQAHQGAIWTMKFSLDSAYLASAGQDRTVRVWEVFEQNGRVGGSFDTLEVQTGVDKVIVESSPQRQEVGKKGGKALSGRKNPPNRTMRLPRLFLLSETSKCTFEGHSEDILDLSWSHSQFLLSSSMDKTVRLWSVLSGECLKIFTHNDYVTCIQFNPVDDGYFISGSLDEKVRIWSIQQRQVVDWADLREMVTAACYTPDGQGAVVGSYKGNCRFYKTSGNKLQIDTTFEVRSNKSKRSQGKKINGFQFIPGDQDKVLITSSDSRIRVYNGSQICSKYKGFRNSKTQISASCSSNGKYVICPSEDSRVCIWNYCDSNSRHSTQRKETSASYEDFFARHVLVAIPWPGVSAHNGGQNLSHKMDSPLKTKKELSNSEVRIASGDNSPASICSTCSDSGIGTCFQSSLYERPVVDTREILTAHRNIGSLAGLLDKSCVQSCPEVHDVGHVVHDHRTVCFTARPCSPVFDSTIGDSQGGAIFPKDIPTQLVGSHGFFSDSRGSATWPEEKLPTVQQTSISAVDGTPGTGTTEATSTRENGGGQNVTAVASACDLVIVTGGRGGEICIFQNYSLPVQL